MNPTASPDSSTQYFITVTDANGCEGRDSITITVFQPPTALSGKDTSVCFGSGVAIGRDAIGGKQPYSYVWNPPDGLNAVNIASPVASPTQTTTYSVTVVDSNGCRGLDSVTVVVHPLPTARITSSGATTFCEGDVVTLDAGAGYAQYLWSTGDTTQRIDARASGTYTVTVTNASGCSASDSIRVTVVTMPSAKINANGPTSFCKGGSVTLSAPGGLSSYRWSTNDSTQSITVSKAGTYSVLVTNGIGCEGEDSITVFVHDFPEPKITASGATTFCAGDSVTLHAGAGYASYRWSTGATTQSIIARTSGSYSVIVSDSIGCSGSDTLRVTVLAKPKPTVVIEGTASPCVGDSVTLRVQDNFPSYRWFNGETGKSTVVFSTNTYYVAVEDSNGCWGESSIPVVFTVRPKPVITGSSSACENTTASYRVSQTSGSSYTWSVTDSLGAIVSGQGTNSIAIRWSEGGLATLRVIERSSTGCIGDTTFRVAIGKTLKPKITASGSVAFCEGDSVALDAGEGYETYRWNNGSAERWNLATESGAYIVRVTDAGGCSGSDTIIVTVNPKPTPVIQGQRTACINTAMNYDVTRIADRTYRWLVTNGIILSGQGTSSITVQWNQQGAGTVDVTETIAATQCSASSTLPVAVGSNLTPRITAGKTAFCEGDSTTLDADAGYATYLWNNGATTQSIVVRNSGSYFVRVTDANGCSGSSQPITISVHKLPQPVIAASGALAFCEGESVRLDAGNGFTIYAWNTGATTQSIVARNSGSYFVIVTDSNGCTATSQPIEVRVFAKPQPVITRSGSSLTTTDAYSSYQWYLNGSALAGGLTQTISITQAGMYSVFVTDSNGCSLASQPYEVQQTLRASSTLELPFIVASPGDRVTIPLRLASSQNLSAVGAKNYSASISFNRSVLYPVNQTPMGIVRDSNRVITLSGMRTDSVGVLRILEFIAVLGEVERTPLHIESFAWDTSGVDAQLIDGEFQLNVCRAGGPRLIRYVGVTSLRQNHPNPFVSETTIEYSVAEYGASRLVVLDALGRQIATLAEEHEPSARRITFDGSHLPSGLYHCVLHTPSGVLHRVMHVVK